MKNLLYVLIISTLFYSCGSDNPVTSSNNNPPVIDSLLFSKDTLALIYPQDSIWTSFNLIVPSYDSVRVQFDINYQAPTNVVHGNIYYNASEIIGFYFDTNSTEHINYSFGIISNQNKSILFSFVWNRYQTYSSVIITNLKFYKY